MQRHETLRAGRTCNASLAIQDFCVTFREKICYFSLAAGNVTARFEHVDIHSCIPYCSSKDDDEPYFHSEHKTCQSGGLSFNGETRGNKNNEA